VHPALEKVEIVLVAGVNVRDAFVIGRDARGLAQARKLDDRFDGESGAARSDEQRERRYANDG
jgi:hypothetical protein